VSIPKKCKQTLSCLWKISCKGKKLVKINLICFSFLYKKGWRLVEDDVSALIVGFLVFVVGCGTL